MLKALRRSVWYAFGAVLIAILLYQFWVLAHIWYWADHNPAMTSIMEIRIEQLRRHDPKARLQQQWVPYDHIAMTLKRAVIAAEDANFVENEGFDWDGIRHAFFEDLKKGRLAAGGSTITQQLAKNLFLSSKRTIWRKAEETLITIMLDIVMTKRRILEIYLNVVEWGNGIFGAQAAARHYFGVSAARLSAAQAAKLAAMLPDPRYYDHHRDTHYLERRTAAIMRYMKASDVP
jgi:monofunctional biosynthetic peptidoglycan transglycosylase